MLRVIAQASPQTRIEGRPASATAPRDRIAGFNARRRVEMWKSTNRISTFPRRTKKRIDWEWPLHRRRGGRESGKTKKCLPFLPVPLVLLFFIPRRPRPPRTANLRHIIAQSMRLFDLSHRLAVVVGGTSGIGRAIALGLAEAGADVVVTGRREALVSEVAGEIEQRGRRSLRMAADVSDTAALERVKQACVERFGRLDIMVYAAGTTKRAPTLQMDQADWDRIIDTNLNGMLRSCQVFGGEMVARRSGRIIAIGSLSSFVGLYEVAAYVASKSGVAGLT